MNVIDPTTAPDAGVSADERQWGMFSHLSIILAALITAVVGLPGCLAFLGPLIIWMVKKETMPFVADQAKEALNFSILLTIISLVLIVVGIPFGLLTLGLGFILFGLIGLVVGIAALVLIIIAAMKANEGVRYRYPFNLRLVK
jgi:uncharacterized Tic20 family protein